MKKIIISLALLVACAATASAQEFLSIVPDARTSGLGGAGTALSADAWSIYNNAAAPLFSDKFVQAQGSYTAWRLSDTKGFGLWSVGGYVNIAERHTVSVGGRLFNMPKLATDPDFFPKDEFNRPIELDQTRPNNKSLDVAYGYRVIDYLSIAVTAGFLHEADGLGGTSQGVLFGIAAYSSIPVNFICNGAKVNVGLTASNIGTAFGSELYNMPITGKVGGALVMPFTEEHEVGVTLDLGYVWQDKYNKSFLGGLGAEYTFLQLLDVRAGVGYMNSNAFGTFGIGVRYMHMQLDFSYWAASKNCPWRNTFSVGLGVEF